MLRAIASLITLPLAMCVGGGGPKVSIQDYVCGPNGLNKDVCFVYDCGPRNDGIIDVRCYPTGSIPSTKVGYVRYPGVNRLNMCIDQVQAFYPVDIGFAAAICGLQARAL